jgi:hypothetical protein
LTGFIILLLVAANVVGSALSVRTRDELSLRQAKLSVANLVILYLGSRSNVLLDNALRLSHTEHQLLHRWIGRVTIIEGLIHGLLEFSQVRLAIRLVDLLVRYSRLKSSQLTRYVASRRLRHYRDHFNPLHPSPDIRDFPQDAFTPRSRYFSSTVASH